jgi:hypothetical protein
MLQGPTQTGDAVVSTQCYGNGINMSTTTSLAGTVSPKVTVTYLGKPCYAIVLAPDFATNPTAETRYEGSDGKLLATSVTDAAGNQTITCAGGTPVTLPASCSAPPAKSEPCTPGVCNGPLI